MSNDDNGLSRQVEDDFLALVTAILSAMGLGVALGLVHGKLMGILDGRGLPLSAVQPLWWFCWVVVIVLILGMLLIVFLRSLRLFLFFLGDNFDVDAHWLPNIFAALLTFAFLTVIAFVVAAVLVTLGASPDFFLEPQYQSKA